MAGLTSTNYNPIPITSVQPRPDRLIFALQKDELEPDDWMPNSDQFLTSTRPVSFYIGTGAQVWNSILPTCAAAEHEVLITTCFWAKSSSQEAIAQLLVHLSAKALSQQRKIYVRICFSSLSLVQNLFHTSTMNGKCFHPDSWPSLGLPAPSRLQGLDLIVKSIFIRPCSVMHPKFVLVDRRCAFVPSCNVSWEDWFEGCIALEGELVAQLFAFWEYFWARATPPLPLPVWRARPEQGKAIRTQEHSLLTHVNFTGYATSIPTALLPSPHHSYPHIDASCCCAVPSPPFTPLNALSLHILAQAKTHIYIQTPNLTCKPVISALLDALSHGVNVHLVTNRRLMLLEQLITAGTTTAYEVWKLRRRYRSLLQKHTKKSHDAERALPALGTLKIAYYHPRTIEPVLEEPAMTHLKLAICDDSVTVLGSGNMDRASWYTSQELGVAFFDAGFARAVMRAVQEALEGRVEYVS
ncbi:hypothetical protein K3495_g5270 [Podosphaera aphanis]|nr:hypothetical protein K3495_g5270 [Podosphaera aphanis]